MQLKNKLKECFKEGERGGERHKGLKKIELNETLIDEYLKKAKHNLNAVTEFKNIQLDITLATSSIFFLPFLISILYSPLSIIKLLPEIINIMLLSALIGFAASIISSLIWHNLKTLKFIVKFEYT
ncbi:MAG: hypothetical protein KKG75_05150 [Nanoarchaeota archaeon]|nr:hypothetical protein [Nanoarchaeota archaeon]